MMTTIHDRSAQVIPFTSRAALAARKLGIETANNSAAHDLPIIDAGAGWYHQAAVDADRGDRNN